MICPKCGAVNEGNRFCTSCGTPLDTSTTTTGQASPGVSLTKQDLSNGNPTAPAQEQAMQPIMGAPINNGPMNGGMNSGYNNGMNAGMNSGMNAGMNSGMNAGMNSGMNAGMNNGYNNGTNPNLNKGMNGGGFNGGYNGGGYNGGGYNGGGYNGGGFNGSGMPGDFDGDPMEYLPIFLVNALVLVISCGLAYPWVICRNLNWRKSHTIINGRRLAFTGTAGDLFSHWIIWYILTAVTCGIYSFWVAIKVNQWEIEHTCYADQNPFPGQTFPNSYYDGAVGERAIKYVLANVVTSFTAGICSAWGMVNLYQYDTEHTTVCGDRLFFNDNWTNYFVDYLLLAILSSITCGIYSCWGIVKLNKRYYNNTYVVSSGNMHY